MGKMEQNDVTERKFDLKILYFYLCGDCNLACCHCWISPIHRQKPVSEKALEIQLFKDIIVQAKPLGLNSVKLTGGEPLIHPDIEEILIHIKEQSLDLMVETNGVLITDRIAGLIRQCKNPFVSVSIDGIKSTHEQIRGIRGSFDNVCKGVEILVDHGLTPQIIMTLMKENQDQIREVVHLAEDLKAGSLKFNFVVPIERGAIMHERGEALTVKDLIHLGNWIEQYLKKEAQIPLYTSLPMAFRPLKGILEGNESNCGFCSIFNILGVLSDGNYSLCGIGSSVEELVFGNAKEVNLKEVWENHNILRGIRLHLPRDLKGVCRDCLMKWRCLGTCIAQNYYSQHDLFSSYWFCQIANDKGIFPESRRI